MASVFDDDESLYLALKNTGDFYSIWPSFIDIPSGWSAVAGPALRAEILAHIEQESNQAEAPAASLCADAKA
ncbi:MAG TPA: MbtH family protein [Acetobacteraceae bacterium]|jgi:uncharacterized protein YbdZ (MbtH family)|nr:MbtH family protein [Acetobacteraceae bacterium]